jgi:flagellar biosynthesis protein FliQ
MPPTASTTVSLSLPLIVAALVVGLLLAATVTLWAYYGTTVFFEVVSAGWSACF